MRRSTHPRSPVQTPPRLSCLPFLLAAIAAFAIWGWRNSEAMIDWWDGEPPAGIVGPTRAKVANLVALFGTDDYPMEAIEKEEQGTVAYRLTIGRRGGVPDCEIVESSGSEALDEQTCRILEERAHFSPARDAAGKRIPDTYSGRIRWVLPDE